MNNTDIKQGTARFNEIEDEIQRLREVANDQAGHFLDGYDGKKNNNVALLIGFVLVLICSSLNIALGVISAAGLAIFIYSVHAANTDLKENMHKTLAEIDKLRAEQEKLGL